MIITELRHTGTYKDGGSKSYKDSVGKEYWRNFAFGDKKNPNKYGKIYKGNINDKNPVLAKGNFIIQNEIINQ